MSEQSSTIVQDLEHLFKKTTDANKLFLTESARFVKKLGSSGLKGEELFASQKQLFKDAVNLFVKLNIQHASNLVDLGVAITQKLNQSPGDNMGNTTADNTGDTGNQEGAPAFKLSVSGEPGAVLTTSFMIDSDKKEPVTCHLKQTAYTLQSDLPVKEVFETTFTPQSFEILSGNSQKVDISVAVPQDAKEGTYLSNINVDGFEHTYFSLYVTIMPATVT